MNPLIWKREHQLALAIAAAIGTAGGLFIAYLTPGWGHHYSRVLTYVTHYEWVKGCGPGLPCKDSYSWETWDGVEWRFFVPFLIVVGWALLGATVGGAVVYARQLLKA